MVWYRGPGIELKVTRRKLNGVFCRLLVFVFKISRLEEYSHLSRLFVCLFETYRKIFTIESWAVGDYCVGLKVLKSPHKEIYSFKLTMLCLSLSSSLCSAKYFH